MSSCVLSVRAYSMASGRVSLPFSICARPWRSASTRLATSGREPEYRPEYVCRGWVCRVPSGMTNTAVMAMSSVSSQVSSAENFSLTGCPF